MDRGVQNPGCQVAWAATFCVVAPNISGSSVWNWLHIVLLAARISRLPLYFSKICELMLVDTLLSTFTKFHTSNLIFKMVRDLN